MEDDLDEDQLCGVLLRCLCLECFDFFFILTSLADNELSSSSSSSRGTGHKSRRILGSGFTSTVTGLGFFGTVLKLEKSANSSTCGRIVF